jgi:hypothetical protein
MRGHLDLEDAEADQMREGLVSVPLLESSPEEQTRRCSVKTIVSFFLASFLLQSYDETVQKLAEDLAKAETASGKVGVGDEYVKLLRKYPKKRQDLLDAASDAYGKAWPDLDPVWRMKLRERLLKLYVPVVPGHGGSIPEGWSGPVDGTHKVCLLNDRVHSGGTAAKLVPGAKARNARLLYTPEVKGAGKKIEFSVWVLSDGTTGEGEGDTVRFWYDGTLSSKKIPVDTPVWTKLSFEVTTIAGSTDKVAIEIVVRSREGFVYVDDLSIKIDGKELLPQGGFEK